MLVLLSFGLVLVATVLLVLGLLADDGLTLIYVSIACSVLAGVVLVVATRMGRPKPATSEAGPAPLPETTAPPAATAAAASAVTPAATPVAEATPPSEPVPADESFAPEPEEETAVVPTAGTIADDAVDDDEDFFPIADYDDLAVNEILPLLPELYADEIDVVEERERRGKGRATILNRLGELREVLSGAPDDTTAAEVLASRPAPAARKAPAKKAPARKATAKKAAPAKAATAGKAAAKKATAKKATAKKATAKKATTKKATAKKATAKKAARPAKKA